jgi:hypothetical protein
MAKRPSPNDKEIIKLAVINKLLAEVIRWLKENGDSEDYVVGTEEYDNIVEQLVNAVERGSDGYRIARELDSDGWSPDSELVDILENSFGYVRHEVQTASIRWFEATGWKPHANGLRVKSNQRGDSKGLIGTIKASHLDGRYTVCFPELGHVETGPGSHGLILDHENLEVVP